MTLSGSELRRVEVVAEVLARRRTEESAAAVLGLSARQTRRLVRAYRDGGGGALIHKARGKHSNNQLTVGVREYVVELVKTRYADFGPTMAAAIADEHSALHVSCVTMRTAGARLLQRAQGAGVARTDMEGPDLFALVGALAWVYEQPALRGRADLVSNIIVDAITTRE